MKLGIIGTSRITEDHIKVIKKLGHDILFISSTRKKSKRLKILSKKHKIKKFFDWKKSIKFAEEFNDCNFLITSRIKDNFKILKECIKKNRFIFVEKPVFLKSKDFKSFQKNNKIFVGYNRIFYNNIKKLKKKISRKKKSKYYCKMS